MIIEASSASQIVERIDELARMLEHGDVKRATAFARELHREAAAHLCDFGFDYDYGDGDDG